MKVSHGIQNENARQARVGKRVVRRGESLSPISEYHP